MRDHASKLALMGLPALEARGITGLGGAGSDNLLEPGEIYKLKTTGLAARLNPDLPKNKAFVLPMNPSSGVLLHIERTTPMVLDPYNGLG